MKKEAIYFDNAATTQIDEDVVAVMHDALQNCFGNPSSIHSYGRTAKALLEGARKSVAGLINASPAEIFFTSGGTEADNTAILGAINNLGCKVVISSKIEHHAVLHTLEDLAAKEIIQLQFVDVDEHGIIDYVQLEELLIKNEHVLVSLMHANNEVANLLDLKRVSALCVEHKAFFHSDTVQTMGHYQMDVKELGVDFAVASAHKFHGPKGVGFLYVREGISIPPLLQGGAQERNMRGGTENLYGILGLQKAFEKACASCEEYKALIEELKGYMKQQLKEAFPSISFNGCQKSDSLYTVLNVCFPYPDMAETLLLSLDINGVAASGGSACSSGSNKGSHVLKELSTNMSHPSIRFSFSKFNTKEEVDKTVEILKKTLLKG